ncbi:MAG: ArdC family protein [Candidatus Ventricola sp.]
MKDIYQAITDRITAQLEQGVIPWHKPWIISGKACAISRSTGKPYSLLNQLILGKPGEYVTFAQIKQEGGRIKRGAKAQFVVFWKWIEQEDKDNPGEVKKIPFLRYYNVFHLDDCDGLQPKHKTAAAQPLEPDVAADAIISDYLTRSGVKLEHIPGDRAFYRPSTDTVVLPEMEQFAGLAEYYSTAFHELTHSTGHASRLNRLTATAHFGNEEYSKEELVAEIGAAALVNHAGLETSSSFRNSAAYVLSWLKALQNDKRLIVSAAGQAEKACSLILNN